MDIKPKNLLQRVLKFARAELVRRSAQHESADIAEAQPAADVARTEVARADVPASDVATAPVPAEVAVKVTALEVDRATAGTLTLRWSVTSAEVARAQTQLSGNPVLCVRLVTFSKGRDAVRREVKDRPGVDLVGQCEIGEPSARAVVSLGLRAGERFVSIAHHVI